MPEYSKGLNVSFNFIKVRLRLVNQSSLGESGFQFQFHKGTIKTGAQGERGEKGIAFQFHKGTIKTYDCYYVKRYNSVSIP